MATRSPARERANGKGAEQRLLSIGELAQLTNVSRRTIRYYEEIGLLPEAPDRASGSHRLYSEAEVERLNEVIRLKNLLGVSLEELKTLLAAEEARGLLRAQLRQDVDPARRASLLEEALGHIEQQLALVRGREVELAKLEKDLSESRQRVKRKLRELSEQVAPARAAG